MNDLGKAASAQASLPLGLPKHESSEPSKVALSRDTTIHRHSSLPSLHTNDPSFTHTKKITKFASSVSHNIQYYSVWLYICIVIRSLVTYRLFVDYGKNFKIYKRAKRRRDKKY